MQVIFPVFVCVSVCYSLIETLPLVITQEYAVEVRIFSDCDFWIPFISAFLLETAIIPCLSVIQLMIIVVC